MFSFLSLYFISFFVCHCKCSDLKPILLVPGLMGSRLHGNVTNQPHWYCSKIINDDVWVNDILLIPPLYKCLLEYIGLQWNNETNEVTQKEGISINPVDFGGLEGVSYTDELVHDLHFIPTYGPVIDVLKAKGYVERETLFGVPYDWRFGVALKDEFWNQVKELVEEAYSKNNKKVVLVGHSMGTVFINYFCMKKMTKEWREKYIDQVFLIAPSIGGSFLSFAVLLTKKIPFLSFIGELTDSSQKLGGVDVHIPNSVIFGDRPLYTDQNGKQYAARDLKYALQKEGIFDLDQTIEKVYELNEEYPANAPPPFDVPCSIIYNDGLETLFSLDRSISSEKYLYGPGDLVVNAEGFDYLCKDWNTTYKVDCLNLKKTSPAANHFSMIWENETINALFDHLNNDKWKKLRNM